MGRRGGTTKVAVLRARWSRWTAIVELFARRRRGCRRVDPRAYRTLHEELTGVCRSLAAMADEPERAFYRSLEDLARPWLTPNTLARADRELLQDLLIRCREAEREVGGRALVAWRRVAPALRASAVAAVVLLAAWGGPRVWPRALDDLQSWSVELRFALRRTNDAERLFLSSIIVIPISMYIVSRVARS